MTETMKPQSTAEDLLSPLGSGRPASRTSTLRGKRLLSAGTCLGCFCGVSSATAIAALVWFTVDWAAKQDENGTETQFCCSNEAAKLFAVINRTESPCRDLFAYVCKNAIRNEFVHQDVAYDLMEEVGSNVIKGTHNYGSQAAVALHAFYTSCVNEVWHQDRRTKDAVTSVLEIANVSDRISGAGLLRFALTVERRYRLRFIFAVTSQTKRKTLPTLKRRTLRTVDYTAYCDVSCYAVALSIINAHLDTNYTRRNMLTLEGKFPRGDRKMSSLSLVEIRDAFGGLSAAQFEAIFVEHLIDINGVNAFKTISKISLLADIRLLRGAQPLSLCYLLLLVALEAMQYIQQDSPLTSATIRTSVVCQTHVDRNAQLWRVTYVAALASPAKDEQLHRIFKETQRRFVEYTPFLRLMAVGNDTERFRTVIGNVSLVLAGDLIFEKPAVPLMSTQGFARNLFLALNFEFEAVKEKARRGVSEIRDDVGDRVENRVYFLNKATIYVSSLGYCWLNSGTINPLLADAAVIASRMAALLWTSVLSTAWSRPTSAALESIRECKARWSQVKDPKNQLEARAMGLRIAAIVGAAGVGTAEASVPAAARPSWQKEQLVWSLRRMSEAQFFYARNAYYTCSGVFDSTHFVNEPVRRNTDFSTAFQCRNITVAKQHDVCENITLPHK